MFGKLRRLVIFLVLADAVGTQVALLLANAARLGLPLGRALGPVDSFLNPALHGIVAIVWVVVFLTLSVYDVRRERWPVGSARALLAAISVAVFVFAGVLYFSFRDTPRLLVGYFFVIDLALLSGIRLVAGAVVRYRRERGQPLSRILIVGTGETAKAAARVLSRRATGIEIVGCVGGEDAAGGPGDLRLLGSVDEVPALVGQHAIDEVIVALPGKAYPQVEALVYALETLPVRVRLVPDFFKLVMVQSSVDSLDGLPLIGLREPSIDGPALVIKRLFDIALTTAGIVLLWPLFVVLGIAIKLDSKGPVLYRQQRVGENGRLFEMYKYRTMVADAEELRAPIRYTAAGEAVYKIASDARVTRLGRFLRRSSLDELPQLINVLRGEMTLVGPRPEMPFIVEQYEPWQRQRLAAPQGITGWWQVNGRSDLPMHLNTQYDLYYIRNYSLWLDLKILFKTIGVVIRGQGAY
ncbi:MAG: sugar transferase [Anaerolineales bacterium]